MVTFLLRKIFRGNLNEAISLVKIDVNLRGNHALERLGAIVPMFQ